jgi:hypothetical protein
VTTSTALSREADARYFVGGRPHGLALDLRGTSYGMGIVVI